MRSMASQWMLAISAAILLAGCAAAEKQPVAETKPVVQGQSQAGWYMESAGRRSFQPCGQSQSWSVTAAADLPARAKAFGLQQDTPVFVRLTGSTQGGQLKVTSVEQFGSPTPVRNCAMNGVVIPAPERAGG